MDSVTVDSRHIGILGGGQLARMMALAGIPLGFEFSFLDPSAEACAKSLGSLVQADFADADAASKMAEAIDIATYDFENVPAASATAVAAVKPMYPGVTALEACQDRWVEKNLVAGLDIPVPSFEPVKSRTDLMAACQKLGFPSVLKTRRLGYDGKGQAVLRQQEDMERAWQRFGDFELILESFVPFDAECSVIGVRSLSGEIRFWPVSRNHHVNGVLTLSRAGGLNDQIQAAAEKVGRRLLQHFDYVGIMTVEFFVRDGTLLVNEIAPRVHNSGHWTIDGSTTSQFDNHIRAITGLPLGSTAQTNHALMFNWLGELPDRDALLEVEGLHWHDYGKSPRPGRKLGHATVTAPDAASLQQRANQVANLLGSDWQSQVETVMVEM